MKNLNRISLALAFAASLLTMPASAQVLVGGTNSFNKTTLSAAQTATQNFAVVASGTGFLAGDALYIDGEVEIVQARLPFPPYAAYAAGTTVPVLRTGSQGGAQASAHVSGAIVIDGKAAWFNTYNPSGACPVPPTNGGATPATVNASPWINTKTGDIFRCYGTPSQWGKTGVFFVSAYNCGFLPTTLTQTTTFPVQGVGATVGIPVINSVTNAAAGTDTMSCIIQAPGDIGSQRGNLLTDITVTLGSQTVAPTSLGTPLLGSIQFPTPIATTQTASVQTITALAGGAVTQIGPTTTVTSVTTAGAFLTFNYQFAAPVDLSTDLKMLVFQLPIVQSAASAMTLNSAGLWVHYIHRQ